MVLCLIGPAHAREGDSGQAPQFGSPDSVERVIETDRTDRGGFLETEIFAPVKSWQAVLEEDYGFSIGADYSAVTLSASEVLDGADDRASGGMVRLYGRWSLTGDGTARGASRGPLR